MRVILYYDIICQFWKNFWKRFKGNPYLHYPDDVEILRAIGLFHVHGHIDSCYARYAPSFIEGAGQIDGEVLETLWAVLNMIHSSIRRMSTSHRREVLDDHMNDSNWKKLVGMGERSFCTSRCGNNALTWHIMLVARLCKKLPTAVDSAREAKGAFELITATADPQKVSEWERQAKEAQRNRNLHPEAMDIYDIKATDGVLLYIIVKYFPS